MSANYVVRGYETEEAEEVRILYNLQRAGREQPMEDERQSRYVRPAEETQELELFGGFSLRYASLSERGCARGPDGNLLASSKSGGIHQCVISDFDGAGSILFGLFEGHGLDGTHCAKYARDGMGAALSGAMASTRRMHEALTSAYDTLNADLHELQGGVGGGGGGSAAVRGEQQPGDGGGTGLVFASPHAGTSALSVAFARGGVHVANVGRCRAILGLRRGRSVVAVPLSHDQTPHRRDERRRCEAAGALVSSARLMAGDAAGAGGSRPSSSSASAAATLVWEATLDDETIGDDEAEAGDGGDPVCDLVCDLAEGKPSEGVEDAPRLFAPGGALPGAPLGAPPGATPGATPGAPLGAPSRMSGVGGHPWRQQPGCLVTRSLGNPVAEVGLGVVGEPEVVSKALREPDQFVLLASHGVWRFLSSQAACDLAMQFADPHAACHAILAEAYRLWLQFDVRVEDLAVCVAWIDERDGEAPRPPPEDEARWCQQMLTAGQATHVVGVEEGFSAGLGVVRAAVRREQTRAVRRRPCPALMRQLAPHVKAMAEADADDVVQELDGWRHGRGWRPVYEEKGEEELDRIHGAIAANSLFEGLDDDALGELCRRLVRTPVSKGDVIIQQGDFVSQPASQPATTPPASPPASPACLPALPALPARLPACHAPSSHTHTHTDPRPPVRLPSRCACALGRTLAGRALLHCRRG